MYHEKCYEVSGVLNVTRVFVGTFFKQKVNNSNLKVLSACQATIVHVVGLACLRISCAINTVGDRVNIV